MLIMFIRKNKMGEQTHPPKNEKDYPREHNEDMKRFRLSHPKELKGIRDIITTDGNVLVTVQTVKLAKHAQN